LPVTVGENNLYVRGRLQGLRHTLDLEASNAEILNAERVLIPEYDNSQAGTIRKFEELSMQKLTGRYSRALKEAIMRLETPFDETEQETDSDSGKVPEGIDDGGPGRI
jgi:hypothetical protein